MRPESRHLSSLPTFEVRTSKTEVRADTAPNGSRVIRGYAAVFNSRSGVLHSDDDTPFVESIRAGAFTRTLPEGDVRALFNHDDNYLLGRQRAGTLRLAEDSTGLEYEITLGTRSYDRDLEESLERGDVFGSSFAFAAFDDHWSEGPEGLAVRELRGVHLFDVGPVVFPAYRAATATLRGLKSFVEARAARALEAARPPAGPDAGTLARLSWFESHGLF